MAKSEKKISIASLDKVLKEQAVDIATEQWFGNEVKIKHTLSFSEALAFVDDVVSSCFHTTGGYMPELQEFVVKSNILTRYANFNLPDNLEHRYSLLYNTDAVDVVIRHINQKQLDDTARMTMVTHSFTFACRHIPHRLTGHPMRHPVFLRQSVSPRRAILSGCSPLAHPMLT